MKADIFLGLFLLSFSSSNAQSWRPLKGLVCTLEGYSSILLQQVDKNGMAVPFDCENTDIKVFEETKLVNHIKPGNHSFCSRIIHNKYSNHPS